MISCNLPKAMVLAQQFAVPFDALPKSQKVAGARVVQRHLYAGTLEATVNLHLQVSSAEQYGSAEKWSLTPLSKESVGEGGTFDLVWKPLPSSVHATHTGLELKSRGFRHKRGMIRFIRADEKRTRESVVHSHGRRLRYAGQLTTTRISA